MKFKFNGDQDCPDWVLAEIATLSRLTSVKTRVLAFKVLKYLITTSEGINTRWGQTQFQKWQSLDNYLLFPGIILFLSSLKMWNQHNQSTHFTWFLCNMRKLILVMELEMTKISTKKLAIFWWFFKIMYVPPKSYGFGTTTFGALYFK